MKTSTPSSKERIPCDQNGCNLGYHSYDYSGTKTGNISSEESIGSFCYYNLQLYKRHFQVLTQSVNT